MSSTPESKIAAGVGDGVERWIAMVAGVLASAVRAGAMAEGAAADLLHHATHPPNGAPVTARRLVAALLDMDRELPLEARDVALEVRAVLATIQRERDGHGS